MTKFWEDESPVTVSTGKNVLQYYPKAGKLSVSRPPWKDDEGKERQGKTVCLDVASLLEGDEGVLEDARDIFIAIIDRIGARLDTLRFG